jgi:hypothetical protein
MKPFKKFSMNESHETTASGDTAKQEEATLGVGDGTGQHFVHGGYDTIKLLQSKILRWEKLEEETARLRKLVEKAFNREELISIISDLMTIYQKYANDDPYEDHIIEHAKHLISDNQTSWEQFKRDNGI